MTENVSSGLSYVNLPHPDSSWGPDSAISSQITGTPALACGGSAYVRIHVFSAHDQVEQVIRRQLSTKQISQQASAPQMRQWPQGIPKTMYLTVSSFFFFLQ